MGRDNFKNMSEELRPIPDFPGYFITKTGIVYGLKGFPLSPRIDSWGYNNVFIKNKNCRVHRLVLQVFGPKQPKLKTLALHKDGDNTNNNISNLYWGDHKDNFEDAKKHGTRPANYGSKNGSSKLTSKQAALIRRERAKYGTSYVKLGKKYKVSGPTIMSIIKNETWKDISNDRI